MHAHIPILNEQHKPADFFAMGAGHVNPDKAVDPGLVYDTATGDYIGFLCGMYTDQEVSVIARQSVNCSTVQKIPQSLLNYPSISVSFVPDRYPLAPVIVERTVRYVGQAEAAMYQAHVDMPAGSFVNVTVTPSVLWFSHARPEQKFTVLVFPLNATTAVQGAIRWVSDTHTVRSPISAMFSSH